MRNPARPRPSLILEGSIDRAIKRAQVRLIILGCMILITFLAVAGKTVKLTFFFEPEAIKRLSYTKSAIERAENPVPTSEKFRKSIYDRNGILISSNLITSSLYCDPKVMIDEKNAAHQLAAILPELDEKDLYKKFTDKTKSFVWLKRSLHPKQKYEINALGIPGLNFEDEEKRIYPHGNLFAHVIGMVGQDGHGLSGLEKYLDTVPIDSYDKVLKNDSIVTTLDTRIQSILHDEVQKAFDKHHPVNASGIVMDVNTGEILAMVSLPDFDPNLPRSVKPSNMFNMATLGDYELGSVFKPFTFATALDNDKINEKMIFDASHPLQIGKAKISDYHAKNRPLSVPEILMYSSNIGTGKIAMEVGMDKMQDYFHRFHFYDKLDTEIQEKSTPTTPKKWSEVGLVTMSFGHGLALSPLHVAAGLSAIVNGGYYYEPTLIKRSKSEQLTQPTRVISKKTSERMRVLLRLVVAGGSGTHANVDGYLVGGKTGTANKIEGGKYSDNRVVGSFIGVFPYNDPKYLVFVVLDDPKGTPDTHGFITGAWVAAPAVANVITRMAPIMKVRPQQDDTKEILTKFGLENASD